MAVLFAIGVADGAALALGELHRTPTAHTSQAPGSIPNAPVTGFGGYQTFGLVSEVSADWSVPKVTGGPPLSDAATWIGVQDPEGAFFQIGITEEDWFGVPQCNGFWSDPDVGFHAQIILSVSPGDQISARLTQGPDRWSGTDDDETSGKTASVPASVHYGTSSTMQVPNGCKRIPVCRVKRLTNHIPRRPWSVHGPASERRGSSSEAQYRNGSGLSEWRCARADGSAERWLRNATGDTAARSVSDRHERFRHALMLFLSPLVDGGGTTDANGKALVSALITFDAHLSTQKWPTNTESDITRLLVHNESLIYDLQSWESAGESKGALAPFLADAELDSQFSNPIRLELGLPVV